MTCRTVTLLAAIALALGACGGGNAPADGPEQVNYADFQRPPVLQASNDPVTDLAFSPDSSRLAAVSRFSSDITVWDVAERNVVRTLEAASSPESVYWGPQGKRLVSSCVGAIQVWDAETGDMLKLIESRNIIRACLTADGKTIYAGMRDGKVSAWNADTGELERSFPIQKDMISRIAVSPDSKLLVTEAGGWGGATGTGSSDLVLSDTSTGKVLHRLKGHTDKTHDLAFSPDGRFIGSCGTDNTVRIWDARTGKELQAMKQHGNWVSGVEFSPDGGTLATYGLDKRVRLWNAESGEELKVIELWSEAAAFSPDGKYLAIGSKHGGYIELWTAPGNRD